MVTAALVCGNCNADGHLLVPMICCMLFQQGRNRGVCRLLDVVSHGPMDWSSTTALCMHEQCRAQQQQQACRLLLPHTRHPVVLLPCSRPPGVPHQLPASSYCMLHL
jgi:hypothetical protein